MAQATIIRDHRARVKCHGAGTVGAAARCLIFTMLDERTFAPHPLLLGRDVAAIEAFCRHLAPRVEVVRGYLPDDAAIVMRTGDA